MEVASNTTARAVLVGVSLVAVFGWMGHVPAIGNAIALGTLPKFFGLFAAALKPVIAAAVLAAFFPRRRGSVFLISLWVISGALFVGQIYGWQAGVREVVSLPTQAERQAADAVGWDSAVAAFQIGNCDFQHPGNKQLLVEPMQRIVDRMPSVSNEALLQGAATWVRSSDPAYVAIQGCTPPRVSTEQTPSPQR